MKKTVSTVVIFAMLLSMFSISVSAQTNGLSGGELLKQYVLSEKREQEEISLKEFSAQDEAIINAEYLQSYIESNEMAKKSYGGCYIDDNQKLHILFIENAEKNVIATVDSITQNTVIYEKCKYTIGELVAIKNHIENFMNTAVSDVEISSIANDIVAVGIREDKNVVFVGIKNCTNEKIEIFKKKICASEAIAFENTQEFEEHTDVKLGGLITTNANGKLSIGFRCKVLSSTGSYIKGFVTAAHGIAAGDDIYFVGTYLGYVQTRVYGGYVDAAFVHVTNTGCEMSNTTLSGAKTLNNGSYVNSFATGATVYKEGYKTQETSGKITSTSETIRSTSGTVISDCVVANYDSDNGDSGGVVFMYSNSKYHVAGIHKGSSGTGAAFVKVKRIKDALEVILY